MKFSLFKKQEAYEFIDKYFIYLALAIVFLIVGAGFTLIVNPAFKQVRQIDVLKANLKQQEYEEKQQLLSQLKKLRDDYAKVDFNDINRLATVLPKGFDAQRIYQQIQQFAKSSGVNVTSIAFSNVSVISGSQISSATPTTGTTKSGTTQTTSQAAGPQVQKITISIGISGADTYTTLKQFVTLLSEQAPLLDLSSLTFPGQSSGGLFVVDSYFLQE